MHVQNAASKMSAKAQAVFAHDNITVPPMTTKTITAFVDQPSGRNITSTVKSMRNCAEAASQLKSHSMSQLSDKKYQSESIRQRNHLFKSRKTDQLPNSL